MVNWKESVESHRWMKPVKLAQKSDTQNQNYIIESHWITVETSFLHQFYSHSEIEFSHLFGFAFERIVLLINPINEVQFEMQLSHIFVLFCSCGNFLVSFFCWRDSGFVYTVLTQLTHFLNGRQSAVLLIIWTKRCSVLNLYYKYVFHQADKDIVHDMCN